MQAHNHRPPAAAARLFPPTPAGKELLRITHNMATPLHAVGLQIWRGALLLADYVLARLSGMRGCVALELGAGNGVAGLVLAAQGAHRVFLTDTAVKDVLERCQANADANASRLGLGQQTVMVRQLDWLHPPPWLDAPANPGSTLLRQQQEQQQQHPNEGHQQCQQQQQQFAWELGEIDQSAHLDYILAADCVYDDQLTRGLMETALRLMRRALRLSGRSPLLLVALEKRINFTLEHLEVRAPAYDYWRTLFTAVPELEIAAPAAELAAGQPSKPPARGVLPLVGRRVDDVQIPQQVLEYQRTEYLECWELTLAPDADGR